MHIAEGMLPVMQAASYGVGAGVFAFVGAREIAKKSKDVPMIKQLAGVATAGVFLISLLPIPIPFTGTSSHPGGTPLMAILLGPWITSIISMISLLFQALFFAHGGLTTLGANTLSLGVVGSFVGWIVFISMRRIGLSLFPAAMFAGFLGDLSIYLATSAQLALAVHGDHSIGEVFLTIFGVFMPTQLPLAVVEGLFTGFVLKYIWERRPDILTTLRIPSVNSFQIKQ